MTKIVVFTGSGISSDSGIATFRGEDGTWANFRIEDVCTPEALARNRAGVIEFYNMRRREVLSKQPNDAHLAIKRLENHFDVEVVTQNVDDLHERAGSSRVTHLHGEIRKLCSSKDTSKWVNIEGWEQTLDARHTDGSLLRPYIVFFGEAVPMMERAIDIAASADILIVVGTSLQVYPAASLVQYIRPGVPVYVVDPNTPPLSMRSNPLYTVNERAAVGIPQLVDELIAKKGDSSQ